MIGYEEYIQSVWKPEFGERCTDMQVWRAAAMAYAKIQGLDKRIEHHRKLGADAIANNAQKLVDSLLASIPENIKREVMLEAIYTVRVSTDIWSE